MGDLSTRREMGEVRLASRLNESLLRSDPNKELELAGRLVLEGVRGGEMNDVEEDAGVEG